MNCPFLTFTGRPVAAAASSRSVWRARNAGIWSRSTTSAIGLAWIVSWTSVVTGRPVSALTCSKIFIPSSQARPAIARPGGPVGLVERRLEDQRDAPIGRRSRPGGVAIRSVMSSGSITHGPAIRASGPILADPDRADRHGIQRGHLDSFRVLGSSLAGPGPSSNPGATPAGSVRFVQRSYQTEPSLASESAPPVTAAGGTSMRRGEDLDGHSAGSRGSTR